MSERLAILAVDGGGTSTTAWLTDDRGHVLGKGVSGPSNIKAVGPNASMTALDLSILSAFKDARMEPCRVTMSCFGLAGFDRPEDKAWLQAWADDSVWADRLLFVNDGDIVVAAGTPAGFGVGVIAGTGSIAVGRTADGRSARSGGWGYLFGDEGSGFSVALEGLRRVARKADGRDLPTVSPDPLTQRICTSLGIESTAELVTAVYSAGFNKARISTLAEAVVDASREDLSIATEILEPAGRELAKIVRAVAVKLGWLSGPLDLAVAGSFVLNTAIVRKAMLRDLKSDGYEINFQLVPDPVVGAVELAKKALLS